MSNDTITHDEATLAAIEYLRKNYDITEPEDDIYLTGFALEVEDDGTPAFWIRYEITLAQEDDRQQKGALHAVKRRGSHAEPFHFIEYLRAR